MNGHHFYKAYRRTEGVAVGGRKQWGNKMADEHGNLNENLREIIRQGHDAQDKYTYFLLAAAGSCIALSVSRTTGLTPTWPMILLAPAIAAWAWSIWDGLKNRRYHQSNLYANAELLKVHAGLNPEVGQQPKAIQAASSGIMKAMESNSDMASYYARRQLYFLLIGASFFIAWHIIDMFINGHHTSVPPS